MRALNADGVLAEVRRRLHRAIDREHDIVRRQRRAVVELDALAQLEAPDHRRLLLPVGGKRRHDFELLVVGHERFVDIRVGGVVEPFVLRVRVHRQDVALAGPAQSLGIDNGAIETAATNAAMARRIDVLLKKSVRKAGHDAYIRHAASNVTRVTQRRVYPRANPAGP